MRRKLLPLLPGAVTGNGRMLVTIKNTGELYRLFWPNIDQAQHLGQFITGIRQIKPAPEGVWWLHEPPWYGEQHYLNETPVVVTWRRRDDVALLVEQADFVLPEEDVLVRQYRVTNLSDRVRTLNLVVYCTFLIDESPLYDTIYLDLSSQTLIQFRRNVFLALRVPGYPLAGYHTGRRDTPGDPLEPASRGDFYGDSSTLRAGAGAIAWEMGEIAPGETRELTLYLAAASSEAAVLDLLSKVSGKSGAYWREETAGFWERWLENRPILNEMGEGNRVFRLSLTVLKILTNRETGGSIAAPEFDPFYTGCGGYGYCWPRDGMYTALALDEAGYHREAREFYCFAARVQNSDGSWQQRYFTNGFWAPTWGKQIDQVGAVLWGYHHHFKLTRDVEFLNEIWPSTLLGAAYLLEHLSPNGLPEPGLDLWEDNFIQSTYAAAAIYGGLTGAAALAKSIGATEKEQEWSRAAETIRKSILTHLWNPDRQCFMRGINRRVSCYDYRCALERNEQAWKENEPTGIYEIYWVPKDTRIDSALLGLVFPFRVLEPGDPLINSTVKTITRILGNSRAGGIHRYEWDDYRGGNPWMLTTLWLGLIHTLRGEHDTARTIYRWALNNASPTGLLPEQVDKERGGPAWAMPLGWSHAMFILLHLALQGKLSFVEKK
ncbi:glycoside hydrolase family 15 protein [Desulfofundulus sp.]|uniref:glycoside hydrolase family 15 protein n=1 Tax=Desulfofundulus sp. TaxID=2282750 RepID=UPI003C717C69